MKTTVRVPAPAREKTPEELRNEDLENRLAAIEAEIKKVNPQFRIPDPPIGLKRT